MTDRLRLRAEDERDIEVVASCVQDALVPLADMAWEPADRRFVLAINRFRWEAAAEADADGPLYWRTHSLLVVLDARRVQTRAIDRRNRAGFLNLLALRVEDGAIEFAFAGGGAIRVETARPNLVLEDVGEPWPTRQKPSHE